MTAALISAPAGQLANRFGFRAVTVPGALSFAAGALWVYLFAGTEPHYLTAWLPAALLLGVGIGISFPILSAASVSAIPSARFAVGGAVNQTARQIGAVLGVALAVAVLGSATSGRGIGAFESWFVASGIIASASAAVSLFMGGVRERRVAPTAAAEGVAP